MEGAEMARRQRAQLERYLTWVQEEGGVEGPTWLDTIWKPQQQQRLGWLKERCVGRIMELGCSWGWVLSYCGGHVGVDHNEQNIALARILNPTREFVVADVRNLPFPELYVDTVMAPDVLEHLPWEDVSLAIREAKRVARVKVLITVPNGGLDTREATSMKHQYLADSERQRAMARMLDPWNVQVSSDNYFIYMEARRL